ncbi:MAG: hypothetical protein ACR2KP_07410 [Egibacteraceae bacterium]
MTAFGKQAMAASMIGAVVAAIAAVAVGTRLPLSEEGRHAVTHLGPGVPALLLGVTTRRVWPRPRPERGTRIARSVLVAGLVIFGVGQVIEAVGAFGYSGYERTNVLAALHDGGVFVGLLGVLGSLAGVALSAFTAVATRLGRRPSGGVVLAAAVAVVVLYVTAGIVFGF